jgi:CelD/BcsL family acetyltransferase involved in cellulose biosynthesis
MKVAVVHEPAALGALQQEWEQLESAASAGTFFASWLWCKAWSDHFGGDATLHLLLARDDGGALLGIAPLSRVRLHTKARLSIEQLQFIGASAPVEHFDFLVLAGREREVLPAMLATLRAASYDVLALANILPDSASLPFLREGHLPFDEHDGHLAPVLDLPGSMAEVLARLQKKKNERFRYYRRRIDRDFPDWSCTTASTPAEVDAAFDTLLRLHQQHWTARGEPGAFADARLTAFYRDLAHRLAARGWLRMYTLQAGAAIVSVNFAFVYAGRFHHFINGTDFDTTVDSPGAVLHYCMIERSIAEGVREYDFMWGEHDYKYDWGGRARVDRTFIRNASLKARALGVARAVVRGMRRGGGGPKSRPSP